MPFIQYKSTSHKGLLRTTRSLFNTHKSSQIAPSSEPEITITTEVTIITTHPTHVTRLPENEADPGWPLHIGSEGYAADLEARENQSPPPHTAPKAMRPAGGMWQVDSENTLQSGEEEDCDSNAEPGLESPVFIKDFGYTPVTTSPCGTNVFLDQGDADTGARATGGKSEIAIVDGSMEVLREMEMLEGKRVEEVGTVGERKAKGFRKRVRNRALVWVIGMVL
jgi:hypothetical protein